MVPARMLVWAGGAWWVAGGCSRSGWFGGGSCGFGGSHVDGTGVGAGGPVGLVGCSTSGWGRLRYGGEQGPGW
ncbi:hypothetical protein [Mycobacterium tuberculosis]|uniref:hypothetical protein n=1 Tax=Mycobacterium tuberculosis TaxID=1773 RepID=UPI00345A39C2